MIRKMCFVFLAICAINSILYAQAQSAMKIDSVGVVTFNNKITDKNGITYDPLPIGTILMYSGVNWEDNATLPGWKACTAVNNAANPAIPNLENTFIMGTTPQVTNNPASTRNGGSNQIRLSAAHLPPHTHSINHDHPNYATALSNGVFTTVGEAYQQGAPGGNGVKAGSGYYPGQKSSGSHSHNIDLPNFSGTSGSTGSGAHIDIRPKYYSVIYIIKVQ